MATAEASLPETEIPEPIPRRSDIAKGIRTVYLNRVAHMGMMLDKVNRQNRRVERYEKFAATGNVKDLDAPESEDEDMGVAIGNEYHYHVQQPTTTTSAQTPAPTVAEKAKSGFGKFVMAAALGAGSLGAGAAGMALYNWATTNKPTTTITQPASKFDYRYSIEQRPTPAQ